VIPRTYFDLFLHISQSEGGYEYSSVQTVLKWQHCVLFGQLAIQVKNSLPFLKNQYFVVQIPAKHHKKM
jgi:hypothetical protein